MGNIPIQRKTPVVGTSSETTESTATSKGASEPALGKDAFERHGAQQLTHQIENRLQAFSAQRNTAAKFQFSNEDVAYLAQTFAAVLKQHPQASRMLRAKLFAKEVLRRKKIRFLFANVLDEDMEDICTLIAEQLDDSPVFAPMLDEVTAGAIKMP